MTKTLTVADKLVLAAATIGGEGESFTVEDLVVAAWKAFPDIFGLRGHVDEAGAPVYPDSNRVFAEIMGTKPVRKQGLIDKTGNKRYRLTPAGRRRVEELQGVHAGDRKVTLGTEDREALRRLLASKAFVKFTGDRVDEITFNDACGFWGISPRSRAKELNTRRRNIEGLLATAIQALGGHEQAAFNHGGETYSSADLKQANELDQFLLNRFTDDIAVINKRTTER